MSYTFPELMCRNRYAIKMMLAHRLKIILTLMNEQEKEVLEKHIEQILLQPSDNIYEKVDNYLDEYMEVIQKGLSYVVVGSAVKSQVDYARDNSTQLNKELDYLVQFDDEKYRTSSNSNRKQMLNKVWNKMVLANTIKSDFSEVMEYIRCNQNNEESIKKIAHELKKSHYRIERKYYSFDAIIDRKQCTITNFVVREDAVRCQEQMLQI